MMPLSRWLISASASLVIVFGQSLRVSPSDTDLQNRSVLAITLDSPRGKEPVALQWELSVPPVAAIMPADFTIGSAAQSVGKSLTCATKPGKQRLSRFACILAGGKKPIGSGTIALVPYRIQWDTKGIPIHVAMENILGVSPDLKPIPIPNVEQVIEIHAVAATPETTPRPLK